MTTATRRARFFLLLSMLGLQCSPGGMAAPAGEQSQTVTRDLLIGAWRLDGMDYSGPKGSTVDPFYQQNSTGILIYDASGWMSVQIAGPNRRAWDIPVSRVSSSPDARDAPLKAAAFDTYYTYFGTWEFDPQASVVTHHIASALIPGETGHSYAQSVALERGRLVFTTRTGHEGGETVRRKFWVRETPN